MTLPDFFLRISSSLNNVTYDEPMAHGVTYTKRVWIQMNMGTLAKLAESEPAHWPAYNSMVRSMWSASIPFLKKTGVLEQFRGDEELRKLLHSFLTA